MDTPTFTDATGQTWTVRITYADAKRLRDHPDVLIDLLDPEKIGTLESLGGDVERFVNALYLLCESQCKQRGIDDEQFGGLLDGESIEGAYDAFMGALIGFFPKAKRPALRTLMQRIETKLDARLTAAQTAIENGQLDHLIDAAIGGSPLPTSGAPSMSSSASSDSTPDRTRSDSS